MSRTDSGAGGSAPAAKQKDVATASSGPRLPRWIVPSTLLVSVAGLGVSIYLTIAHYTTTVTLACPETSTVNCEKVTTSAESVVFGIPVAVLGLVYFVAMLGLNSPPAWSSTSPLIRWARMLSASVGICFVGWLVYSELFKIDAICLWCTSVHVLNLILFSLIAVGTAATAAAPGAAGTRPAGRS
jgi:uncharacterized membrane protein